MDYAEGKEKYRAAKSESSPDGTGNVTSEMVLLEMTQIKGVGTLNHCTERSLDIKCSWEGLVCSLQI